MFVKRLIGGGILGEISAIEMNGAFMRGGGHCCIGAALRDESLLIDLGRFTQVSIDHNARVAVVQPAVTRMLGFTGRGTVIESLYLQRGPFKSENNSRMRFPG